MQIYKLFFKPTSYSEKIITIASVNPDSQAMDIIEIRPAPHLETVHFRTFSDPTF